MVSMHDLNARLIRLINMWYIHILSDYHSIANGYVQCVNTIIFFKGIIVN